jgi:hypothetical protein
MSNFTTRPNLDNRDFTQTSGSSLSLYGVTTVVNDGELNIDGILRSKGIIIDATTGGTGSTIGYGLIFNGERILLQPTLSNVSWGSINGVLSGQTDLWRVISGTTSNVGDITGATNGLTKVDKDIRLGGRLSGTTTIIFEQTGSTYGNISYVLTIGEEENAFNIRTTSNQATNPITEIKSNASEIQLSHSDDITVSTVNVGDSGNEMLTLDVTGGSYSKQSTGIDPQINLPFAKMETVRSDNSAVNQIRVIRTGITITLQNFNNSDLVKLEFSNDGGTKYTDNRIINTGIEYAGNYRTGFTQFTLVDKGFVEQLVSNTSGSTVVLPSAITRTELFTYISSASTYTVSTPAIDVLFLDVNGIVQRKNIDYSVSGNVITLLSTYDNGDIIQVVYYQDYNHTITVEAFWGDIYGTLTAQTDLVNYIDQQILASTPPSPLPTISGYTNISAVTSINFSNYNIFKANVIGDLSPLLTGGTEGLTYVLRLRNESTGTTYNLFWSGNTYYRTDSIPLLNIIEPSTTNDYYIFRLDNYYKINVDYSIAIVTTS